MTRYIYYFYTGGIALDGVEVRAESLKESAKLVEQKIRHDQPELLFSSDDIKCFADESEMMTGDYIYSYGYTKLYESYARLRGIAYDDKFLPLNN